MRKEIKREQELVTLLSVKSPKTLGNVAAFLSKAESINETAPMCTKWHKFWGKNPLITGSEMCFVSDLF